MQETWYGRKKGEKQMSKTSDPLPYWNEEDYWRQNHPEQKVKVEKHDISPANYILDLHPYCENCPAFEVEQEMETICSSDIAALRTNIIRLHTITCAKKPICEQLYSFIERKYKK